MVIKPYERIKRIDLELEYMLSNSFGMQFDLRKGIFMELI
jgi:hypothetical protein